jgi:tetratricopeptide (TPR) repeat protein
MNRGREYFALTAFRGIRAFFILFCGAMTALAGPNPQVNQERIVAEQAYDEAKLRYQTNSANADAGWQFARACFDLADIADKDSQRAALGREGMDACRRLLQRDPNVATAHYYLGMNIGQVAQTKTLGALPLVRQMQKEWEIALALDPHCDFAGPDRNLGVLYRDTPGPPLSIGNRAQALQHMLRAVELSPDYPENYLNLIESQIKWHQMETAARELDALRAILPAARKQLTGAHWQGAWTDWQARQDAIEVALAQWRKSLPQSRAP